MWHTPRKKKILRAKTVPYVTKIMKRSDLQRKCSETGTLKSLKKYKK